MTNTPSNKKETVGTARRFTRSTPKARPSSVNTETALTSTAGTETPDAAASTAGSPPQCFAAFGTLGLGATVTDGAKKLSDLALLAPAAGSGFGSSSGGGVLTSGAGAGSAGAGAGTTGRGFSFNRPTAVSFGTPKNSAPSAAPSGKDAVGFQQVSIKAFFSSCYLCLLPHLLTHPRLIAFPFSLHRHSSTPHETGGVGRYRTKKVDIAKRDDGPHCFLAREGSTGKVVANHSITTMSKLQLKEGTDATLFWCAQDFSTNVLRPMTFYLKFADPETAAAFKEKVEELQK